MTIKWELLGGIWSLINPLRQGGIVIKDIGEFCENYPDKDIAFI